MNLYNKINNDKKRINLNCIILIFYLISFFISISLIVIFIVYQYTFKLIGFLFILIELILLGISIMTIKNIKNSFKLPSNMLIFILLFHFVYFLIFLIYIIINKISFDLQSCLFSFCFIWCIFHIILISISRYYIINKKFTQQTIEFNKLN